MGETEYILAMMKRGVAAVDGMYEYVHDALFNRDLSEARAAARKLYGESSNGICETRTIHFCKHVLPGNEDLVYAYRGFMQANNTLSQLLLGEASCNSGNCGASETERKINEQIEKIKEYKNELYENFV